MFPSAFSRWRPWLPVVSLAFAAFIFNTSEFAPVGLLSDIARTFEMEIASTGLMITIYAWIVSLVSLPAMIVLSQTERRGLLLMVFVLFILSHMLSALAWNFTILMISRLGVALAHAVFWSITAAISYRTAPAGKQALAVSMVVAGSTLASILGLPIGRIVSEWFGWRITFLMIGLLALIIGIVIYAVMPKLPSHNAGSIRSLPILVRRPALMGMYGLVLLIITAHFTAYSYIEPLVLQIMQFEAYYVTYMLLMYGLAGLLATLLFNQCYRRYPIGVLVVAVAVITMSLLVLLPLASSPVKLMLICAVWGMGITVMTLVGQLKILELASDSTDVATAMFSGIYNVGIGGGALVGSQVILVYGLANVGTVGGMIGALALLWCLAFCLPFLQQASQANKE